MALEKHTENNLVKFLKSLPGCFTTKIQAGSIRGLPDRLFVWRGLVGFLECKKENLQPTPEQMRRLASIEEAGGFARVVNEETLDEVKREIIELPFCESCGRLKCEREIEWRKVLLEILATRSR